MVAVDINMRVYESSGDFCSEVFIVQHSLPYGSTASTLSCAEEREIFDLQTIFMSFQAFQAKALRIFMSWVAELTHDPKYLKSVTSSRSCPLCVCSGGTEGELHVITLFFGSLVMSPTWRHCSSTCVCNFCACGVIR